jgi:spore maturation protein CgeB
LDKIHYNENAERPYDVTFVGGVSIARNTHVRRVELLNFLSRRIKMNLFLMEPTLKDLVANWIRLIRNRCSLSDHFELLRNAWSLRALHRLNAGPIFGVDMYAALAKSKIALNVHIDSTGDSAANFRLFEATGVGCCLLTDWKTNISELFKVDQEVVVYKSFEECLEKIRHLLDNKAERKKIAEGGFKRTHGEHTLKPQVEKFGDFLIPLLNS